MHFLIARILILGMGTLLFLQSSTAETVDFDPISKQNLAPRHSFHSKSASKNTLRLRIRYNLTEYFQSMGVAKSVVNHKLFSPAIFDENPVAQALAMSQVYFSTNENKDEIQAFIQAIKRNKKLSGEGGFMVAVSSGGIELSMAINGEPDKLIIMDYNPVTVKAYFPLLSSLICSSRNRLEFLCRLTSRDYRSIGDQLKKDSLKDGMEHLAKCLSIYPRNREILLKNQDFIQKVFPEEQVNGLHLAKDILKLLHRRGSVQYQITRLLEKLDFPESWFYSEEHFLKAKEFLLEGRLLAFYLDLSEEFPKEVVDLLATQGKIRALYFSNLIDYLKDNDQVNQFVENTAILSSMEGEPNTPLFFGSQFSSLTSLWGQWNKTIKEWFDMAG